ncbi:MAG TPA: carbohydrate ABC transporter permease [Acidimicrobiales bacterium]|nr:carbohydrate ABC transporter permease [Acidimicrobiales bacterium]
MSPHTRSLARPLGALLACAPFALVPLFLVVGSLRRPGLPPSDGFDWLPGTPYWSNFGLVEHFAPAWARATVNSLVVVAVAVPVTVVVASWAAVAITLADATRRRLLVAVTVVGLTVPATALWVPRFVLFRVLGLIDSPLALMAPALMATTPFYVLLLAVAYRRVPKSLFEAAVLEGLSPLQVWRRVALPLARPATVAVAMLAFAFHWSNFVDPLLYLNSDGKATLPLALSQLRAVEPAMYPVVMAGAVVLAVPPVLAFALSQRALFAATAKDLG